MHIEVVVRCCCVVMFIVTTFNRAPRHPEQTTRATGLRTQATRFGQAPQESPPAIDRPPIVISITFKGDFCRRKAEVNRPESPQFVG